MKIDMDELLHHISYGDRGSLESDIGERSENEYNKMLLFAVECDEVECLKVVARYCDPEKTFSLRRAAQYGHKECVTFLLPSRHAEDALIQAIYHRHFDCVKIITPHCSQDACTVGLHNAIESEDLEIAEFLLDYSDTHDVLHQLHNKKNTQGITWLEQKISQRQHDTLHNSIEKSALPSVARKI